MPVEKDDPRVLKNVGGTKDPIYAAKEIENDSKKNHKNLIRRLAIFTRNCETQSTMLKEWEELEVLLKLEKTDRCICGHSVVNNYLCRNKINKTQVILGSVCVQRLNKKSITIYNQSQRVEGYCVWCYKFYNDIHKHYNSESHITKYKKMIELFKWKLLLVYEKKHQEYLDSFKRHCIECKSIIEDTEPLWKIRCLQCYVKYMSKKPVKSTKLTFREE